MFNAGVNVNNGSWAQTMGFSHPQVMCSWKELEGWFPLNSQTSNLDDHSYHGHNTTITLPGGSANPSWGISNMGFALEFNAANSQYLTINRIYDTVPFCICAWVYYHQTEGVIANGKASGDGSHWFIGQGYDFLHSGNFTFAAWDAVTFISANTGITLSANQWHFVAGIMHGTPSNTDMYVYYDGVLILGTTGGSPDLGSINTQLGRHDYSGDRAYFDGFIRDVRFYDRRLDIGELNAMWRAGPNAVYNYWRWPHSYAKGAAAPPGGVVKGSHSLLGVGI